MINLKIVHNEIKILLPQHDSRGTKHGSSHATVVRQPFPRLLRWQLEGMTCSSSSSKLYFNSD